LAYQPHILAVVRRDQTRRESSTARCGNWIPAAALETSMDRVTILIVILGSPQRDYLEMATFRRTIPEQRGIPIK
jgi:hypothetical protein